MDKVKLRKEVQTLRSLVKTTRTNIVRKLIRDRKFWSNKPTGSTVNKRVKKKLEATAAIFEHIRSLKTSQLIKDLLRSKPTTNGAPVEAGTVSDRVVARFRADKKLSSHLEVLERHLCLKENLLNIIKKRKAEKKTKTSKPKPIKGEKGQKKTDQCEPSKEKGKKKKTQQNQKKSDAGDDKEEDPSDLDVSGSDGEINSTSEEESDDSEIDYDADMPDNSVGNIVNKKTGDAVVGKPKKVTKQSLKDLKPPEDDEDEIGSEFITDSFFVTEAGSSYVSVAPKLKTKDANAEGNDDEEEEAEPWRLAYKRKKKQEEWDSYQGKETGEEQKDTRSAPRDFNKRPAEKSQQMGPTKHYCYDQRQMETDTDLHPSWAAKQMQKGIKPFVGKKIVFDEATVVPSSKVKQAETLHPSWAAKQAQKGIKPFAGKKVVFDEEQDTTFQTIPKLADDLHPSWAAKQAQKGIKPFRNQRKDEPISTVRPSSSAKPPSDLHPSWVAKQAQKGIKPFAGKRMVFDEENAVTQNFSAKAKPADGLHPSWAAKQTQKGIKTFVGKKITFGEDDGESTDRASKSTSFDKSPFQKDFSKPRLSVGASKPQRIASDLHPSWAAKQAQKGIKPFAGKKISFGDE